MNDACLRAPQATAKQFRFEVRVKDSMDVVVVGAGPYGLSIAAHLEAAGVRFRIFGSPMSTWKEHMPQGMVLKSDGFASNLSDPRDRFTLEEFCRQEGFPYAKLGKPVPLETFHAYGVAFQRRFVPGLEQKDVARIGREAGGFRVELCDGETLFAKRVVVATGITHFAYLPPELSVLPRSLLTHSSEHDDLSGFRGKKVTVLGGGASAADVAAALHEQGAEATILTRRRMIQFHDGPAPNPRPLWQRVRHPGSGLGPSWRSRFCTDAPLLFRLLPARLRLKIVRVHLGPAPGWAVTDKVVGKVGFLLGYSLLHAEAREGKVRLTLSDGEGNQTFHTSDHLIAATGYRPDVHRLGFLSEDLRSHIATLEGAPALSSRFESSVAGLYFVGLAASHSFGPLLRFAFGARFTARRLARHVARSAGRASAPRD